MIWHADRLAAELGEVQDVMAAARLVVARLREQADLLPSVYLSQGDRLRCLAIEGYWQTFDGIPAGAGVIGRAFASGRRTLLRDVAGNEHYLPAAPDVVDELSVPLVVSGSVVGMLTGATMTTGAKDLAPNTFTTFSGATLQFKNSTTANQDGCKGATVNLSYTAS